MTGNVAQKSRSGSVDKCNTKEGVTCVFSPIPLWQKAQLRKFATTERFQAMPR